MTPLTPIQQIVGLGRWVALHSPTTERITNATIGWSASVICMQTFKDHARAPVLAACLLHHRLNTPELAQATIDIVSFDPYEALSELEHKIVEFSVTLAELHELSDDLKRGNIYVESHLVIRQEKLTKLNEEIAQLSKAESADEPTPQPERKEYKH